VLSGLAFEASGQPEAALDALEHALDLAEPRGYRLPVLRYGTAARPLLRRLVHCGTRHRALAGELLEALDATGPAAAAAGPLLEPLSEKELAVLRFLPTMMSNGEIAG